MLQAHRNMALQNHLTQVDALGRIVVLVEVVVEACGSQEHTMEVVTAGTREPRIIALLDKEVSVIISHQWSSRYMHKLNQS